MANKTSTTPTAKLEYDSSKKQKPAMGDSPRANERGDRNNSSKAVWDRDENETEKENFKKGGANKSDRNNRAKVVSVSDASATEGEQEVFTVGLSKTTKSPTKVSLELTGETATVRKDFSRKIEASFDGGQTWKSVARDGKLEVGVGVKDFQVRTKTKTDNLVEGTETFKLTAKNSGGSASGTGTILDAVAAAPAPAPSPEPAPTPAPAPAPAPEPAPAPAGPSLSPEAKAITDKGASNIHVDTDLDGLNTTSIKQGIKFDIFSTGTPINVGWGNTEDGLLAIDNNGNGKIDNGTELFGGGVGEGFAKLATFDSNKDGVVDAKDTDFNKLLIWTDINQNGLNDPGELLTLKESNVASINLGYTNDFKTINNGNLYGETTTGKTPNGTSVEIVEVYYPIA